MRLYHKEVSFLLLLDLSVGTLHCAAERETGQAGITIGFETKRAEWICAALHWQCYFSFAA